MDRNPPFPADDTAADTTPDAPADTTPSDAASPTPDDPSIIDFTPAAPRRQKNSWSAKRQRVFVDMLAETGSVREAAATVGMSARSAYRLRGRIDGVEFAQAWDAALRLAASRLVALAFERVLNGLKEETWKEGALVSTRIRPSEKLHMFLIQRLVPMTFGNLSGLLPVAFTDPVYRAIEDLAVHSAGFKDVTVAEPKV